MRKRTKVRKQLKTTNLPAKRNSLMRKLLDIETKLQESYNSQQSREEEEAVATIKSNPRYFYSYARNRQKMKTPIGPLNNEGGTLTNDPGEMANILADQYNSVFSVPATDVTPRPQAAETTISDITLNEEHIIKAITELNSQSASGPDRFPALLLKNCKESLAKPLCIIWRASLDSGEVPELLKKSTITPIFKKGDKRLPENYRPVALTSHLVKVFEKVLRNQIVQHIEENNLLNPNQHGFRAGRSCLSQLVQHYDKVTKLLEEGKNVDVIYLDFSKAFDKLDFKITISKVEELGITGKLSRWIQSFLTGRQQSVCVSGQLSSEQAVPSGIPQGSVIGPLLFLILLGDIDSNVQHSAVSSFADDTRVLGPASTQNDVENIQHDLNAVYQWSTQNNMKFSDDKFECIRYYQNKNEVNNECYLSMDGSDIEIKAIVKDLGVTMSSTANFFDHICNVTKSANSKAGWILRTSRTRSPNLMLTLWKSLVMPILDYCCQLWTPSAAGQIQQLENVQMAFLRKIETISHLNYWEQLSFLKLYSLQRRRERYIVIYVWKLLEKMVPNFGINTRVNPRTGRFCLIPHVRTVAPTRIQSIRFASLSVNGPRLFNSMPKSIRNITDCSVDSFKAALDKHLASVPDEPRVRSLIPYCSRSSNSLLEMKSRN